MTKVFIDGSAGTTGLRIYERLEQRKDIELIKLSEELRKDDSARKDAILSSDISFLCLPDSAAIDAVKMAEGSDTVIIDTSTAHRTDDSWVYGFPELTGLKEKITFSKRIANPGCHASGFIALIRPLIEANILNKNAKLSCFSLTGYSGGGKKMISQYESENCDELFEAPRAYGLNQTHKHLPEMKKLCMLENAPVFMPVVSSYYAGMEVTVPLFMDDINGNVESIEKVYSEYYMGKIVSFTKSTDENGFLSAGKFAGKDSMEISVYGNDERITLVSRFDNLGKGASGAAIQNMNVVLGIEETAGLDI